VTVLSNPDIVQLLKARFVPVAVDQHDHGRRRDAEGDLFRRVVSQAAPDVDGYWQGFYIFTPGGRLLEAANTVSSAQVRRMMASALERHDTPGDEPAQPDALDPPGLHAPPPGGLVIEVTSKVVGGPARSGSEHQRIGGTALGRDHLWLRGDEAAALARAECPESVKQRIARYHLVDNTRGEPPFWAPEEVRHLELALREGRLSGAVHLETADGGRGYRAEIRGVVEAIGSMVTRLDVVARGHFWGEGPYTPGAPPGRFPFAVAFHLIDPRDDADHVPPGGARGSLLRYLHLTAP
jgi:hypothetical protein